MFENKKDRENVVMDKEQFLKKIEEAGRQVEEYRSGKTKKQPDYEFYFEKDMSNTETKSPTMYEQLLKKERYEQKIKNGEIDPTIPVFQNANRVSFPLTPEIYFAHKKMRGKYDTSSCSPTISVERNALLQEKQSYLKGKDLGKVGKIAETTEQSKKVKPDKEFGA